MFSIFRILFAIVIYLTVVGVIYSLKPVALFNNDGTWKPWGIGAEEGRSIFSLQITLPIIAILSFFFASFIDVMYLSNKGSKKFMQEFMPIR